MQGSDVALKRVYLMWYVISTQEELSAFDGPTLVRRASRHCSDVMPQGFLLRWLCTPS